MTIGQPGYELVFDNELEEMVSREGKALDGVRRAIPDDEIIDVALTYPRGTTLAEGEGMALGGLASGAMSGGTLTGAGQAGGFMAGDALISAASGLPPSIVIAVSATTVYTLGRYTTSPFGNWNDLVPLGRFDRSTLRVDHRRSGALIEIRLTDVAHDTTLIVEAKPVGNLGVTNVLKLLDEPAG